MFIGSVPQSFHRLLHLCLAFALCAIFHEMAHAQNSKPPTSIGYTFPLNGSTNLPRETMIILRPGPLLNPATITSSLLAVSGSLSGKHFGILQLSDDRKTLVFTPNILFAHKESVTVHLTSGLRTSDNTLIDPRSFSFTIEAEAVRDTTQPTPIIEATAIQPIFPAASALPVPSVAVEFFPTIINHPTPGAIILAPYYASVPTGPDTSYMLIINDSGRVLWQMPTSSQFQDFKLNSDGRYSYFDIKADKFYAMDSAFTIVDSFRCPAPYPTDYHDFELLPNNHALMIASDTQQNVDMSQYVAGGSKTATIIGVAVIEIDSSKKPIFIWRSRDTGGYVIHDITEYPIGLKASNIDAVHANSVIKDTDGNIVLSARHLDEITKISYDSAKIIWRFGGKHNQFTLSGDSLWFSHQHHVRRIENGNFTLFDNGNDHYLHTPGIGPYTRACEYRLDEQAKTAKLVWQFDEGKTDTSTSQGSVQRLKDSNTFISWGDNNYYTSFGPAMTEVRPDGTIAFEMSLSSPYVTYRAFRLPANTPGFTAAVSQSSSPVPTGVSLSSSYPNPCSGVSRLIIELPKSMTVSLRLYDALGHEVSRIASGLFSAGVNTVGFDASGLVSGVYHCVLRTESGVIVREVVVAR